ncbi:uncharacterized protein LOC132617407 [Lycium barbarum]|uniref:uncharacterized protein LOC132617407 n=1 Tax=Lycium barbarum TaxID=112863 RepID=UPI00293E3711|nr:uncharacterized protein LOC132617407 [Lycium barbarum]
MELKHCFSCIFLLFSFSILAGVSASASLSDGIFVNEASTGRNLLQEKKPWTCIHVVEISSTTTCYLGWKSTDSSLIRILCVVVLHIFFWSNTRLKNIIAVAWICTLQ